MRPAIAMPPPSPRQRAGCALPQKNMCCEANHEWFNRTAENENVARGTPRPAVIFLSRKHAAIKTIAEAQ